MRADDPHLDGRDRDREASPVLQPDTFLNHYRILRPLGEGGMGEVYEAEDTRLKRRVALKLLPHDTGSDAALRARFEREAQTVASLNHPNIVTIYSVEESTTTRFLTMEIVEGGTIDRLLPPTGLPLADLLKYAIPIVDAVATAHARGIVHRDLKPTNVMVARDGRVKVLDFGVAKLMDRAPADAASVPTVTGSPTLVGQIVGTAAYMSPEQAEGRPVDHRSDIFSIGILLYELATGVRPFRGATSLSILSAIIKDEPEPMTRLRPGASRDLERIVNQCLAKDVAKRPQSAADLRTRLASLIEGPSARGRRLRDGALAALAVVLLGLGAAYALSTWPFRARETALPKPIFARVTDDRGIESWPSLSSDSRDIVYAGRGAAGEAGLYLRSREAGAAVRLSTEASDDTPAFSPDGDSIAFSSARDNSTGIFVMDRRGESVRRLTNGGSDPSWTPDGLEVVYSTESGRDPDNRQAPSQLWAVNVTSGQRRRIAEADAVQPRVSPDGRLVAFWGLPVDVSGQGFAGANREIWVQPLAGGERVAIAAGESTDWNPGWAPDGRTLYFSSDRGGTMNIWRVAVDPKTGRPSGEPFAMTAPTVYASHTTVALDGTIAYAAYDYSTLVRSIGFDPISGVVNGAARDIVTGQRAWLHPDVSPDGGILALRSFKAQEDVWVVAVDGSGLRAVTNDPPRDRGPRWGRDGSLLFYSARSGRFQFWTIRPDASGLRQLTHGESVLNDPVPSRNGRWVAGSNPNTGEQFIFDAHDWTKPPERLPSPPTKSPVYLRDWSPDGMRIAAADTSGGLWTFDLATKSWDRIGSGSWPRWLPDGRRLLATFRSRVMLVDTTTKTARETYGEPGRLIGAVVLAPDGRRLYFTSAATESDIWTMRFSR
jgi:serine/threonine protein kinase/Tol biopolymer transport system component